MRVYAASPIPSNGGTIFYCEGPADAGIQWTLTGNGALTPSMSYTNANGIATAYYNPAGGTPASAGDSITVTADCYE